MWWSTSHSNSVFSKPCGKVSHHTAHQLDLLREPYATWKNRGALEVRGVLSLLGWALPYKAPPSGHKHPLATHLRGAVLAFPDQDRSHTCCVRDRPTQLCIDRKAGWHNPQPREWLRPVCPPLFPTCYGVSGVGRSGLSLYRLGATAASGSDLSTRQFIR
ncbi:hypothetical protein V6N13_048515 [Hibiscus sabdariffa]